MISLALYGMTKMTSEGAGPAFIDGEAMTLDVISTAGRWQIALEDDGTLEIIWQSFRTSSPKLAVEPLAANRLILRGVGGPP